MPIIERDVVMIGKDGDGNITMDFPVTRLGNIEDTADVKDALAAGDYIPVMDGADAGQMKKALWGVIAALFKASGWKPYHVGASAPDDKTQLWIDTTASTGGLKYYNGSAWVHVPVAYT